MSEKKTMPAEFNIDLLLADALLRLTALERVLIEKNVVSKEELNEITTSLVEKVNKLILDRIQTAKGLDDFITSLGGENKKSENN